MSEAIVLDPPAVATGRTGLTLTPFIKAEGLNWGDAAFEAIMAEGERGSRAVDGRLPNRIIEIPLALRGTGFKLMRANLQEKVGLFQREGGWLERNVNGVPLYADVVNATLHLGGSIFQAYRDFDLDAVLTLECVPDWYGAEVDLGDNVETTNPELIFSDTGISGNYPGRTRIVVDNDESTAQNGLLWGFRSRHYDNAATAALAYECEALGPLNGAASAALSGASGGNVLRHNTLPAGTWAPIMVTNIGGTTPLTHKGTYRVWLRAYSTAATPEYRLKWGSGGISAPTTNQSVQLPTAAAFHVIDLGEIRLVPPPVGTHQWFGVVEAKVAVTNDYVGCDRLWLQPVEEGAGRLTSVQVGSATSLSNTRPPALAQNDATSGTVDWVNPNYVNVHDGTAAGVGLTSGQVTKWLKATNFSATFVPAGATIRGIRAKVWTGSSSSESYAVTNDIRLVKAAGIQSAYTGGYTYESDGGWTVYVVGGPTDLWGTTWTAAEVNANANFGVASQVTVLSATQSVLYVVDFMQITVWYTLSTGFTAAADAVIYGNSPAELRTEGMFRRDSAGTAYGPISSVVGDLPRIPPSGLESRTVQTFLKGSRGNFDSIADSAIDNISARVYYRPSYLYVPGTA